MLALGLQHGPACIGWALWWGAAAGPAVRRAGAGPAPRGAARFSQLLGLLYLLGSVAACLQSSLLDLLVHVQHRDPL